jgi:DNA polymerase III alpha subunit (gram-positive type)
MSSEIYISVDVETAGPIPGAYSLLAIGACVVGSTGVDFFAELKPINGRFVPEAMKVVGASLEEYEARGLPPEQVMRAFGDWLEGLSQDGKPVFVGFNATFDWSFVNWYFHTYLEHNPFGIGGIDIKSYYMALVNCSWADTRSDRIPKKFKGSSVHTHNALDDAVEQAEMFQLMLEEARGATRNKG